MGNKIPKAGDTWQNKIPKAGDTWQNLTVVKGAKDPSKYIKNEPIAVKCTCGTTVEITCQEWCERKRSFCGGLACMQKIRGI